MELQNKIVAIAGRKGSGKSTSTRFLLEHCSRVLVFDPLGEHTWVPNTVRDYDNGSELAGFLKWAHGQPRFAGRLVPVSGRYSLEVCLECMADNVYRMGNLLFAVEEVPMVSRPGYLPPKFDRVVRLGRHQRVSVIYTAQRLSETARRLTAATDYFWLFAHSEPRDLDAISDRCGSDVAEKVARLGIHDSLILGVAERREVSRKELLSSLMGNLGAAAPRQSVTVA
jgi:hypothetical protein